MRITIKYRKKTIFETEPAKSNLQNIIFQNVSVLLKICYMHLIWYSLLFEISCGKRSSSSSSSSSSSTNFCGNSQYPTEGLSGRNKKLLFFQMKNGESAKFFAVIFTL